ncbi:hypothetical protein CYMTET_26060 [Cymbomonas tetramitiformis]|uniref:Hexosyltransferase n=1 Tax=Cymbomonas tetramitiformis TaxID=36881 RepID=A0AAE0FTC0_9CHLO|nr:hypothetical protein CYMTET_26060 [Cymbomonas tetramitiformis]
MDAAAFKCRCRRDGKQLLRVLIRARAKQIKESEGWGGDREGSGGMARGSQAAAVKAILTWFPDLKHATYYIDKFNLNSGIRSMSYRSADLESPLNYARIYLPQMMPSCVRRCIYLDTDMVVLDRIELLWETNLGDHIIASPEFCEFKFHRYFTQYFWENKTLSAKYESKREACYFNPGVMLFDTKRWLAHNVTQKLLHWMDVQKHGGERIYRLGSLPPFLLVFSGNLKSVDRTWNLHDLGCGCNVRVDPKVAKLLHWSCDGKPWRRLEGKSGKPCSNDKLYWKPYDLIGLAKAREKKEEMDKAKSEQTDLETASAGNGVGDETEKAQGALSPAADHQDQSVAEPIST